MAWNRRSQNLLTSRSMKSRDGGEPGGRDDDDAGDVRTRQPGPLQDLTLRRVGSRSTRTSRWTPPPFDAWAMPRVSRSPGTPGLGAPDPVPRLDLPTRSGCSSTEGRTRRRRSPPGDQKAHVFPDPLAARGGPHHLILEDGTDPSRAPRAVSLRPPGLGNDDHGERGGPRLASSPLFPAETHGEQGRASSRPSRLAITSSPGTSRPKT